MNGALNENEWAKTPRVVDAREQMPRWGRLLALGLRLAVHVCLAVQVSVVGLYLAMGGGLGLLMLFAQGESEFDWGLFGQGLVFLGAGTVLLSGLLVGWASGTIRNWQRWLYVGLALWCGTPFTLPLPPVRWEDLVQPGTCFVILAPMLLNLYVVVVLLHRPWHPLLFGWPEQDPASA